MNRTELLTWLDDQPWCDHVGTLEFISDELDRTIWCRVFVREVYEDSAISRWIHFYVVNQNQPDERAYWKDAEPTATLIPTPQPPTYRWISYRTMLAELDYAVATAIIGKITAAAVGNPVIAQVHTMLSSYGGSEPGIDINSPAVQALVASMAGSLLTQAEAAAVVALAQT